MLLVSDLYKSRVLLSHLFITVASVILTAPTPPFFFYAMQVMLRVSDLDKSIEYYTAVMGMTLLRKRDVPEYKYTLAFLGYGEQVWAMCMAGAGAACGQTCLLLAPV